jgi:hypothetical protein
MKTRNIATCIGVLSACLAISSPAVAEDNCSGINVEVWAPKASELVQLNDDRNSPEHLASGKCAPTGAWSNKCTFKDKDGDEWTSLQEWTGFGSEGTWGDVSGTGKYAKRTGAGDRGWWKRLRTMYSPRGEPVFITAWGGSCTR